MYRKSPRNIICLLVAVTNDDRRGPRMVGTMGRGVLEMEDPEHSTEAAPRSVANLDRLSLALPSPEWHVPLPINTPPEFLQGLKLSFGFTHPLVPIVPA